MKCPTCGTNLQIEDEKCPFCGNPNPFAVKHRQDMRRYHREFQKTRQEVEKKAQHFNSFTAKVTVIAVLFVMVILMVFVGNEGPFRIWSNQLERDVEKNGQQYGQTLRAYEEKGEWRAFYAFYEAKAIGYTDVMQEYRVLPFAISEYKGVLNELTRYRDRDTGGDASSSASRIANYLDNFYRAAGRTSYQGQYYDECYTPERQESYDRMAGDLEAALFTYCHLTKEELALLPDYSVAKKSALIEEGLLREASDEGERTK